jgi:hypothetical protein
MPVRHTVLEEKNFDRNMYLDERPLGLWRGTVDLVVYSKGSKISSLQKGKRSGIHLYVEHENGQKIWLFVPLLPGLATFAVASELKSGDNIEVEIGTAKSGLSVVKQLQKLG